MSAAVSFAAHHGTLVSATSRRSPVVSKHNRGASGGGAPNRRRRGGSRLAAVTEPTETVTDAAPFVDPIEAFCAEQMPDETAMLAASTFPIPPEVRGHA